MIRYGNYEDLAGEYYDSDRHPTCANFRSASTRALSKWKDLLPSADLDWTCEVGSGRSLLAEALSEWRPAALPKLLLIDRSAAMLEWSRVWASKGAHLIHADAARLPVDDDLLGAVVSILGDGYNTPEFWSEAARVLRHGGIVVFTVPSYRWSVAFRTESKVGQHWAEFEVAGGDRILVPSVIRAVDDQAKTIEMAGLIVKETHQVSLGQLDSEPISPKLQRVLRARDPVVDGFLAVKP